MRESSEESKSRVAAALEKPLIPGAKAIAADLEVDFRSVYEWAARGEIPCLKLSGRWYFPRDEYRKWKTGRS